MKRVSFCHVLSWRDPGTKILYHADEHQVLHVIDDPEAALDFQNFEVADNIAVEPGDYWNGDQDNPIFSKEMFLGLGPAWDPEAPDQGRAGFNAG